MNSELDHSEWVKLSLSGNVGGVRLGRCSEGSKIVLLVVNADQCGVATAVSTDTKKRNVAISARMFPILLLRGIINIAEVCKSIVRAIPVDVVNCFVRPLAYTVKPSKPVCQIQSATNGNLNIAILTNGSGFSDAIEAFKHTRVWVVLKYSTQTFCANIFRSHDAITPLIGERPAVPLIIAGLAIIRGVS